MSNVKQKIQVRHGRTVFVHGYTDSRTKHEPERQPVNTAAHEALQDMKGAKGKKAQAEAGARYQQAQQMHLFGGEAPKPVGKAEDPRAAVKKEGTFPAGESHLAQLERKRQAMVKQGPQADHAERKALETQYLKTWQPMIQGMARDAVKDIGVTPSVNDRGQPEGLYADFIQEANIVALGALRHHHDDTHRTHVRDLVRGNVKRHLFERWRSIIGVQGTSQDNAELSKLAKISAAFRAQHGKDPSDADLAQAMGKEPARIAELKEIAHASVMRYLEEQKGDDPGAPTLGETLRDTKHTPEEAAEHKDLLDHVTGALGAVKDPRARLAIALEQGLDDHAHGYAHEVASAHHLDNLAREAHASHVEHGGTITIPELADELADHPALKGKTPEARRTILEGLKEHGFDPVKLLTDYEGVKTREGAIRNHLAQRLGMSRSAGGKWVQDAYEQMRAHEGLKGYHDTRMSKAHGDEHPLIKFVRVLFGGEGDTLSKSMDAWQDREPKVQRLLELTKAHQDRLEDLRQGARDLLAFGKSHHAEIAADPAARWTLVKSLRAFNHRIELLERTGPGPEAQLLAAQLEA